MYVSVVWGRVSVEVKVVVVVVVAVVGDGVTTFVGVEVMVTICWSETVFAIVIVPTVLSFLEVCFVIQYCCE